MSEKIFRLNGVCNCIANSVATLMSDNTSLIRKIIQIKKMKKEANQIIEYELFTDEISYEFLSWLYNLIDNSIYSNPEILKMDHRLDTRYICIIPKNKKYEYMTIKLISYNIVEIEFKSRNDYLILGDFKFQFVVSTKFETDETEWSVEDRNKYYVLWILYRDMIIPYLDFQFPNLKTILLTYFENKRGNKK